MSESVPSTVTTVRIPTHLYESAKKENINFSAVMRHALEAALKINSEEIEKLKKREQELLLHQQKTDAELNLIRIEIQKHEDLKIKAQQEKQAEDLEKLKRKNQLKNAIVNLAKSYRNKGMISIISLRFNAESCNIKTEVLKNLIIKFYEEYNCDPERINEFVDKLNLEEMEGFNANVQSKP